MHIVRFFPIGNADTCLIELANGRRVLFDFADMLDLLPSLSFLGSCRLRRKGRGFPGCRLPGSCFAVRCLQCLGIAGLTQTQQASIPEGPSVFAATLGTGE